MFLLPSDDAIVARQRHVRLPNELLREIAQCVHFGWFVHHHDTVKLGIVLSTFLEHVRKKFMKKKIYPFALFRARQFDQLFRCLAENRFEQNDQEDLMKLWDTARYEEERQRKNFQILLEFYERDPHPTSEAKREIARRTDLSMTQITNWFKSRRQREKTTELAQR